MVLFLLERVMYMVRTLESTGPLEDGKYLYKFLINNKDELDNIDKSNIAHSSIARTLINKSSGNGELILYGFDENTQEWLVI